jgi:APA family basic amino acid/polyamine antiporter
MSSAFAPDRRRQDVEEAADMRAAAIIMALPRREHGASLFGKTLETVLAERPCRIMIEAEREAPLARSRARRMPDTAE